MRKTYIQINYTSKKGSILIPILNKIPILKSYGDKRSNAEDFSYYLTKYVTLPFLNKT